MIRLLAAEALKLRTTLAFWGFLAAAVAIVALGVAGQLANRDEAVDGSTFEAPQNVAEDRAKQDLLDAVQPTGDILPLFAILLGALAFTAEFRHGTISQTFLVTPRRERVVAAKAATYALAGGLLAAVAVGVALAIALPWLAGETDARLVDRDALTVIAGVLGASALWGVLGVGLGAVVRRQVLAIVAVLVWLLILEGLLAEFFLDGDLADYLPGNASRVMSAQPEAVLDETGELDESLSRGRATLVTGAYAALAASAGAALLRRRDVS